MSGSIQVQIDSAGHSAERILLAATLASVNGAHLTGLYVVPEPRLPATLRASFAFPEKMQSHTEAIRNEARTWDGEFRQIVQRWDVQPEHRIEQSHRTGMGSLSEVVALHAHDEDLVVVGGGETPDPEVDLLPRTSG